MRFIAVLILLALLLPPGVGPGFGADPASSDVVDEYVSRALQGDLSGAAALFASLDPDSATARERKFADDFQRRFIEGREEGDPDEPHFLDPFVRSVVHTYHAYWRFALLHPKDAAAAEDTLFSGLERALRRQGIDPGTRDDTLERMGERIDRVGFHHIGGKTLPLWELMIWAREDTTRYNVRLTDEVRTVTVVFVRDFRVRGWSHWATFGSASTGGWAGQETLFCLGDEYDVDSEAFRVSYLRHETRHFADYERFPKLQQIDLEYRAKLTELAYADTTLTKLIENFARSAQPNPDAPHAFANDAVVRAMSRGVFGEEFVADEARWKAAEAAVIHAAARKLLERNTRELEAAGAATTTGVVGAGAPVR